MTAAPERIWVRHDDGIYGYSANCRGYWGETSSPDDVEYVRADLYEQVVKERTTTQELIGYLSAITMKAHPNWEFDGTGQCLKDWLKDDMELLEAYKAINARLEAERDDLKRQVATIRREALEDAAKVCDEKAASIDPAGSQTSHSAWRVCNYLSARIRALIEGEK